MLVVLLRVVLLLVALVLPGGLLVLAMTAISNRVRRGERLDFDGTFRRVPDTRRGRHARVLVSGT
jgi:hypothetical protein